MNGALVVRRVKTSWYGVYSRYRYRRKEPRR